MNFKHKIQTQPSNINIYKLQLALKLRVETPHIINFKHELQTSTLSIAGEHRYRRLALQEPSDVPVRYPSQIQMSDALVFSLHGGDIARSK